MKAFIDRFEGDYAVVLFGNDEIKVDVPKSLLPVGSKEGSWLDLECTLDIEGEMKQRDMIKEKIERLKNKGR